MNQPQDELDPPFEIIEPEQARGPVLFNSPHSGRVYPRSFLQSSRLDLPTLRRSEDSFVDDLALGVVARGYPLMRAHFPRCFVDVNREPYELDPRMFEGRLPVLCQHPIDAGGRRARTVAAWSATRRKSTTSASRSMMRSGASRSSTSPITARCAGCYRVHRSSARRC